MLYQQNSADFNDKYFNSLDYFTWLKLAKIDLNNRKQPIPIDIIEKLNGLFDYSKLS